MNINYVGEIKGEYVIIKFDKFVFNEFVNIFNSAKVKNKDGDILTIEPFLIDETTMSFVVYQTKS